MPAIRIIFLGLGLLTCLLFTTICAIQGASTFLIIALLICMIVFPYAIFDEIRLLIKKESALKVKKISLENDESLPEGTRLKAKIKNDLEKKRVALEEEIAKDKKEIEEVERLTETIEEELEEEIEAARKAKKRKERAQKERELDNKDNEKK
ncbi:MAG: hypothetical protein HQ536_03345 [Parcubacteria group bacterium]|nr:hypothetical protein [Parcubacteria group bacterium]